MKRKIIALVLIMAFALSTSVYAYRWQEMNGNWYVINETTGEIIKNTLIDTNNHVYCLDQSGKMITSWYKNPTTNKYFFFDNNPARELGAMVFGLHMIDGYYYYFGDDGSLQTSGVKGELKKVFQDYYADMDGYLYQNGALMRDTSVIRSESYTNPAYYTNPNFNNFYLATYDEKSIAKRETVILDSSVDARVIAGGSQKSADTHKTDGGTDYYIDEWGQARGVEVTYETRPAEKYGPMIHG